MKRPWRPRDLAVLSYTLVAVLLVNFAQFGEKCEQINSEVVRLHILANSDSETDQALKLQVRDRILTQVSDVFSLAYDKQEAKATAAKYLPAIQRIAQETLAENGIKEPVLVELCKMYFSTREYDDLALPAGNYDAVRVTLGKGAGANWWCVMYPPICLAAAIPDQDKQQMEHIVNLNGEPLFRPKLAIVELIQSFTDQKSLFS